MLIIKFARISNAIFVSLYLSFINKMFRFLVSGLTERIIFWLTKFQAVFFVFNLCRSQKLSATATDGNTNIQRKSVQRQKQILRLTDNNVLLAIVHDCHTRFTFFRTLD